MVVVEGRGSPDQALCRGCLGTAAAVSVTVARPAQRYPARTKDSGPPVSRFRSSGECSSHPPVVAGQVKGRSLRTIRDNHRRAPRRWPRGPLSSSPAVSSMAIMCSAPSSDDKEGLNGPQGPAEIPLGTGLILVPASEHIEMHPLPSICTSTASASPRRLESPGKQGSGCANGFALQAGGHWFEPSTAHHSKRAASQHLQQAPAAITSRPGLGDMVHQGARRPAGRTRTRGGQHRAAPKRGSGPQYPRKRRRPSSRARRSQLAEARPGAAAADRSLGQMRSWWTVNARGPATPKGVHAANAGTGTPSVLVWSAKTDPACGWLASSLRLRPCANARPRSCTPEGQRGDRRLADPIGRAEALGVRTRESPSWSGSCAVWVVLLSTRTASTSPIVGSRPIVTRRGKWSWMR